MTMGIKLKYRPSSFTCSLLLLALVACRKEELRPEDNEAGDKIAFSISDDYEPMTKSGGEVRNIELEVGREKLSLALVVEDNDETSVINGTPQTRGSAYDNGTHPISSIDVSAIIEEGNGGKSYFRNETVGITSGKGVSDRFWPDQALSFFAYAVSKDNVTVIPSFAREDGLCKGNFDYTLPDAAANGPKKDATNQPDVVFAITPDQLKTTNSGEVNLIFHHALSAVVFKVGEMPDDVFLTSVAIDGVYSSGTCTMSAAEENDIDFVWSYADDQVQNASYTEEIGEYAVRGEQMGGDEAIFMMLPQEMGADSKIILTFNIAGKDYIMEKAFKDIVSRWDADKKYVFSLGVPAKVDVEVEDMVEANVKKELTIQNTGTEPGYIRAAIVGYWVNNAGDVVLPWSESDGEFVWGSQWNSYWKKGTDGFYYYQQPVDPNAFTYPLFDTYTLDTSTAIGTSHAFCTLEFSIITQIISEEDKNQWVELNK